MAQNNTASILSTFNLTDTAKQAVRLDKNAQRRAKLLANLSEQRKMAEAMLKGEDYVVTKSVWTNGADGKDVKVEKNKRIKRWFYNNGDKAWFLELRFANKAMELTEGKTAIAIQSKDQLVETIDKAMKAVEAKELDTAIEQLVKIRRSQRVNSWNLKEKEYKTAYEETYALFCWVKWLKLEEF